MVVRGPRSARVTSLIYDQLLPPRHFASTASTELTLHELSKLDVRTLIRGNLPNPTAISVIGKVWSDRETWGETGRSGLLTDASMLKKARAKSLSTFFSKEVSRGCAGINRLT